VDVAGAEFDGAPQKRVEFHRTHSIGAGRASL
jgi:hypothetical protein